MRAWHTVMERAWSYGRFGLGTLVTILLAVLWLGDVIPRDLIMAPIIGFVGGFLMRSWWSAIATPLTLLATVLVSDWIVANNEPASDSELTATAAIVLGIGLLLLISAAAASGAGTAKWLRPNDVT